MRPVRGRAGRGARSFCSFLGTTQNMSMTGALGVVAAFIVFILGAAALPGGPAGPRRAAITTCGSQITKRFIPNAIQQRRPEDSVAAAQQKQRLSDRCASTPTFSSGDCTQHPPPKRPPLAPPCWPQRRPWSTSQAKAILAPLCQPRLQCAAWLLASALRGARRQLTSWAALALTIALLSGGGGGREHAAREPCMPLLTEEQPQRLMHQHRDLRAVGDARVFSRALPQLGGQAGKELTCWHYPDCTKCRPFSASVCSVGRCRKKNIPTSP